MGGTQIPLAGARVLTYGGSTIHWGGWSLRLKPEDFHLKSVKKEKSLADWPITYNDLEPYYGAAEHYIRVSGDSADKTVPRTRAYPFPRSRTRWRTSRWRRRWRKVGVKFSHLPIARHGITDTVSRHACQTTGTCKYCPFGARYAATNFLNDMLDWEDVPNFQVRTDVIVEEILLDSRQKAAGVQVLDRLTGRRG